MDDRSVLVAWRDPNNPVHNKQIHDTIYLIQGECLTI